MKQKILHNFALYVPGLQQYCDMDEIIYEIAPRNILITSGIKDERHFPLEGIEKIETRNKNNENFKSIKFDDGHLFNLSEKEIFESHELEENRTIRKIRTVQNEGTRSVSRELAFYSLDAIMA